MKFTDVPKEFIRYPAIEKAIADGAVWSPRHADAIVDFTHRFYRPVYIPPPFRLTPWQESALRFTYGLRWRDGSRVARVLNIHCPKKQGKNLILSCICNFELWGAGVDAPFVASGSTTKENATQVYQELANCVQRTPLAKFARLTPSKKQIEIPSTNGRFLSLSSDGDGCQGYPLSLAAVDEYHSHKNDSLYDSLRYSIISRQGLLAVISTAGDDVTHPYYSVYEKSKRVMSGDDLDYTHAAFVWEVPPGSEDDPAAWRAANPSMGVTFSEDDFRRDHAAAKTSSAEWMKFRRYRLNQWVRPEESAFLDIQQWNRNATQLPDAALVGCPCWMGADLSTSIDPSSVSLCWLLPDGRYHVRSWAWICSRGLTERDKVNAQSYRQYILEKSMTETPGDMIEHRKILDWMRAEAKRWRVKSIRMDGNNAQLIGETLMSEGHVVEFVPQYPRHWNWPLREWERCVVDGRLTHSGSTWLRDCCANLRAKANERDELRPMKPDPSAKIDGFISACLAFTPAALESAKPKRSARIEVW